VRNTDEIEQVASKDRKFLKKALTLVGVELSFCASYRVNSYKSAAPKLFLIERVGGVGFFVVMPERGFLAMKTGDLKWQISDEAVDQDTQRILALPM
jgi:hypothetical protein